MKPRLSKDEWLELVGRINYIRGECFEICQIITQRFPKSSRTYKLACSIDKPLVKLKYDMEANERGK